MSRNWAPRVRGEKEGNAVGLSGQSGSPPRARGKALYQFRERLRERITPACAGKRSSPTWRFMPMGDHPRACGEKDGLSLGAEMMQGSPPRVRGKDLHYVSERRLLGITPARAGKSLPVLQIYDAAGDHPRACGEKSFGLPLLSVL